MVEETEVFKLYSNWEPPENFDKTKCYAYAHYTRKEGTGPYNYKYFTTRPLEYLGKHVRSEKWQEGGAEIFIHNGKETRIPYDIFDYYQGTICYKIVPCLLEGGKKKRRSRKMKKNIKKSRRINIENMW
jgi:hypothetical protein